MNFRRLFFSIVLFCIGFLSISKLTAQITVQMTRKNGVSVIPCKVNGLDLNFIYDTGASDVSISLTEALFMLKNGYLKETDFIGTQDYSDANGDIEEGMILNIESILIGGLEINDVKATVVKNTKAPLLLGQSALSKLGIVQQDFRKNTLTILPENNKFEIKNSDPQSSSNDINYISNISNSGRLRKFYILPQSKIKFKPLQDKQYFWYNEENNSIEKNVGSWGGPLLNGELKIFNNDGSLAFIGSFNKGIRFGYHKYYNKKGLFENSVFYGSLDKVTLKDKFGFTQIFTVKYLSNSRLIPMDNLKYTWFDEENDLEIVESTIQIEGPVLNGKYQKINSAGNIVKIAYYKNGLLNGESKYFNSNGVLTNHLKYKLGIITYCKTRYQCVEYNSLDSSSIEIGYLWLSKDLNKNLDTFKYFSKDHKLYRVELCSLGKNQVYEIWPNGKLHRDFNYYDEYRFIRNGEYRENFQNGILRVKGQYSESGEPIGTWVVYEQSGILKNKILFKLDSIFSKNKDTLMIGYVYHNKLSNDISAQKGWKRVGKWEVFIFSEKINGFGITNLTDLYYPQWNPESVVNAQKYAEFSDRNLIDSSEIDVDIESYLRYLNNYYLKHSFLRIGCINIANVEFDECE